MTLPTASSHDEPLVAPCWCCGALVDPASLVRLSEHPEVGICSGCARWLSKRAWELEDRDRTGLAVQVRQSLRTLRALVIRSGLHNNRLLGRTLRRLGRFTP